MATQYAPIETYQGPALDIAGNYGKGLAVRQMREEGQQKQEEREAKKGILAKYSSGEMSLEDATKAMLPYSSDPAGALQGQLNYEREAPKRRLEQEGMQLRNQLARNQQRQQEMDMQEKKNQFVYGQEVKSLKNLKEKLADVEPDQADEILNTLLDSEKKRMVQEMEAAGFDEAEIKKATELPSELTKGSASERMNAINQMFDGVQMQLINAKVTGGIQLNPQENKFLRDQGLIQGERQAAQTDLGKLTQDFKNGYLTEDQYKAEAEKAISGSSEENFEGEDKLRDEYNTLSKDYFSVERAYDRIEASGKDPSAAGDLALIFNYMKMLDPGSTVREGEFANAENSAGVPARIRAQYNKVTEGKRLAEEQRNDFMSRAKDLMGAAEKSQDTVRDRYSSLAKSYGLDPKNIISEKNLTGEGELKAGTVEDGYEFLGGDPADQNNWKKVE